MRLDLATATASPPPWLTHRYPEVLPVTKDGVPLSACSRQQYCPSSPVYRRLAARLASKIAERYADHPALAMWHINNEYGCHVSHCYCEMSGAAFRAWLEERYGTVDALNAAWGTAFWSQRYSEFAEVQPPRAMPTFGNPGQLLDFDRFSADQLLELYRAEAAIVRAATPSIPVTTNFMGFFKGADYWAWAQEVDVVSDDSYPDPADPASPAYRGDDPRPHALAAARSAVDPHGAGAERRELAPRNAPKVPGQMAAWSKQAIARGADGILFFQWRQSVAGAEKFHSGMVPHAGTDTRVWREITELGSDLADLGDLEGSRVDARVAIVFEWDSWWSLEQAAVPTRLSYVEHVFAWYAPLFERNVVTDFVRADADLSGYDTVIVPSLFCATPAALDNLAAYADGGGHLVVTFQTGIVDENMHITSGGYLGSLQRPSACASRSSRRLRRRTRGRMTAAHRRRSRSRVRLRARERSGANTCGCRMRRCSRCSVLAASREVPPSRGGRTPGMSRRCLAARSRASYSTTSSRPQARDRSGWRGRARAAWKIQLLDRSWLAGRPGRGELMMVATSNA